MRALHITDKPSNGGGIRRAVDVQRQLLTELGWQTDLFRLYPRNEPQTDGAGIVIDITRSSFAASLRDLHKAAQGFDAIHLHLGFSSVSPDLIKIAATCAPLLVNLHDVSPFAPPKGLRALRLKGLRAKVWQSICGHAHAILAPSTFLRDQAINAGAPRDRTHLVPHWVPVGDQARRPPSESPPDIVYAGLMSQSKGALLLLNAFAKLRSRNARLWMIGDGPQLPALVALAKRANLDQSVRFTGALPHVDVMAHMANARTIAMPSLVAEGLGLSGIEAMRLGRPVVGLGRGGMSDWLIHDNTGLISDPQSDALAYEMSRLLDDADLADQLGAKARQFCQQRYGYKTAIQALRLAYPTQHEVA